MNEKKTTPPLMFPGQDKKDFYLSTGTGHYSHLMSSFSNFVIGLVIAISMGGFFIARLLHLIFTSTSVDASSQSAYWLLIIATLVLSAAALAGGVLAAVSSSSQRAKVNREEVRDEVLIKCSRYQAIVGLVNVILTSVLLALEIAAIIILSASTSGAVITPSFWWIILLAVSVLASIGYLIISLGHIKAVKNGREYYLAKKVEPISMVESIVIGIGSGAKNLGVGLFNFIMLFIKAFINLFVALYKLIVKVAIAVAKFAKKFTMTFIKGTYRTKLSYFFMGLGHALMGRPVKTILYLILEAGYWLFMFLPQGGFYWLSKFDNLGDQASKIVYECSIIGMPINICPVEDQIEVTVFMDNSMLITLFAVATILLTAAFFALYWISIRGVVKAEETYVEALKKHESVEEGTTNSDAQEKPKFKSPLPTFRNEVNELLNSRFHLTTLSIPAITITVFTLVPLVFMILLAFTNFNQQNGPPNTLFTWVGLQTFAQLFTSVGGSSFSKAFGDILGWTFIWAFFATFSNYILGLILAMMINRKGIKLKKMWRTIFVITIAVPQFVTLLLMSQLLYKYGPLNETLLRLGWISEYIDFLTVPLNAKIAVILVNVWVGVPYTMLITSGILMNIPDDLYESARIDGAGRFTQFVKITLPYMLFVTGPYLITQFIGNINNFNVIFFLTGGGPSANLPGVEYGKTDILVTWLYRLTVGGAQQEYAIGSALGIFIFLISAFITLSLYAKTSAATQEGDFA